MTKKDIADIKKLVKSLLKSKSSVDFVLDVNFVVTAEFPGDDEKLAQDVHDKICASFTYAQRKIRKVFYKNGHESKERENEYDEQITFISDSPMELTELRNKIARLRVGTKLTTSMYGHDTKNKVTFAFSRCEYA